MIPALRTLLWEFARRGWWRMLQAQAAVLGVAIIIYTSLLRSGPLDPAGGRSLHFVLLWIFFVALGGAALATQGDSSRFYLLPLTNRMLAAICLLPGLCCMWGGYVITAVTLNGLFDVGWPVWGPALFLAAALGAIQAATRLAGSGRLMQLATWSLIAIPFEGWLRARYGGGDFLNPRAMWTTVTPGDWLSMAGALVVEYGVIAHGVARERCGEGPLLGAIARRASVRVRLFSPEGGAIQQPRPEPADAWGNEQSRDTAPTGRNVASPPVGAVVCSSHLTTQGSEDSALGYRIPPRWGEEAHRHPQSATTKPARRVRLPDASPPFSSAAAAQFWFEWRQKGLILPATFAAFALFVVVAYALGSFRNGNYELLHLCIGYGVGLGPIAAIVGLILGHSDVASSNAECGTFLGARPMSNAALSAVALKAAGVSLLLTWSAWTLCLIGTTLLLYATQGAEPVVDLWTDHGRFAREFAVLKLWYAAFLIAAYLFSAWTPLALGMSLVQTGRQGWIVGVSVGSLVALLTGLFLWVGLSEGRVMIPIELVRLLIGGAACLFTGLMFAAAYRRRFITDRMVGLAIVGWLVLCVVAGGVRWQVGSWSPTALVMMAGMLALPLAPLAASPLALAWNRHR
jgi:hypothetical protein